TRPPATAAVFFQTILRGMSDEAHLPAEQSRAQAPARLPRPDGDRRRPQGPGRAPQPRPQEVVRLTEADNRLNTADSGPSKAGDGLTKAAIGTLRRRADFLAANGARRAPTP